MAMTEAMFSIFAFSPGRRRLKSSTPKQGHVWLGRLSSPGGSRADFTLDAEIGKEPGARFLSG
jgi:hypothetical protein